MKPKFFSVKETTMKLGVSLSYFYKAKKNPLFVEKNLDKRFYSAKDIDLIVNIISKNSNLTKKQR